MASRYLQGALSILLLVGSIAAQIDVLRYRVAGTVMDVNGSVIPGVTVTLTDKTGNKFEAKSLYDGSYSITMPAGTYSVIAEQAGQRGVWEKFSLNSFEVGDTTVLAINITLKLDPDFIKAYGTPVTGGNAVDPAASAVKIVELDSLTKAIVDRKLVPIWKNVKCDDPSQLYVINYGPPVEKRRRRELIAKSIGSKCDLSGFRLTFVDGPDGRPRTVVWQVPAGAKPPVP